MAVFDNRHSRAVAYAKVILPLAALAMLATLFLFDRAPGTADSIPYARVDVETLAREQRLGNPTYGTVTEDGTAITFRANAVRPEAGESDVVNAARMTARFETPDGATLDLTADEGVIDGRARIAELGGSVDIVTSTGYRMTTDRIAAELDRSTVETTGAVQGSGPAGTLEAGRMILTQDASSGQYLLVFNAGVKLVYVPQK
ncbi:hypothetical protein AQS8620_00045 [Aquimixticola soesokkakensis]|uniref:Lipopolysaccharide-assembly, LptC-related n=1 Tax=Aquimixticola soesokkakensis TaxID=1519096 RepID=A0A1Y5R6P5_9RHOB|nr:LPS export ABC transporter periplasmic protein LptC [Aquimixticola soesokkakensis]SLN10488.1 hypothetical protein AQS8620_00045 [Aquimixticola soesokkakensis]